MGELVLYIGQKSYLFYLELKNIKSIELGS